MHNMEQMVDPEGFVNIGAKHSIVSKVNDSPLRTTI